MSKVGNCPRCENPGELLQIGADESYPICRACGVFWAGEDVEGDPRMTAEQAAVAEAELFLLQAIDATGEAISGW